MGNQEFLLAISRVHWIS